MNEDAADGAAGLIFFFRKHIPRECEIVLDRCTAITYS